MFYDITELKPLYLPLFPLHYFILYRYCAFTRVFYCSSMYLCETSKYAMFFDKKKLKLILSVNNCNFEGLNFERKFIKVRISLSYDVCYLQNTNVNEIAIFFVNSHKTKKLLLHF